MSSPEVGPAAETAAAGSDGTSWWPHPDGYAMVLPAGWWGVAVDGDEAAEFMAAIASTMPGLALRIDAVLGANEARVSAVAADPNAAGEVTPLLLVLAQPRDGRRAHVVKTSVREQITSLPGLTGVLSAHDVVLPNEKGVRFDYTIDDPDLGELQGVLVPLPLRPGLLPRQFRGSRRHRR